jgi:nucleotide-binding universal stress UspA family protein
VQDGNHRVSVARRMGATHIEAEVTEIETKVPLSPDVQPDDLILKAEYADFLEETALDELRPEADLSVTVPGQYRLLLEHIDVHRYFMGLEQQREILYPDAVAHWYDTVYLPVVEAIGQQDILQGFPGRTETDLYLWVSEYRRELQQALGWEIETEAAVADLFEQFGSNLQQRLTRMTSRLLDAVTPDGLEGGPTPGTWRRTVSSRRRNDCMFSEILVPLGGGERGWSAVAQAVEIACREQARLLGLHVVRSADEKDSEQVQAMRAEFEEQCRLLGVDGRLAVQAGPVARTICARARWADLVVMGLSHPPGDQPLARLGSGVATLIRRCNRPLLTVPGTFSPLERPLLAYDGSPKAKEALYIATYLAARGQVPLVVITVDKGSRAVLDEAGAYLDAHGVEAILLQDSGPAGEAIMNTAREHDTDLILMGGYGRRPVVELMVGSTVDHVLRASQQPVLVCR